jgi:hypothetical protein
VPLRRPRASAGTNTFEPTQRPSLRPFVRYVVRDGHRSVFPVSRHCLVLPSLARSLAAQLASRHTIRCHSTQRTVSCKRPTDHEIVADRPAANPRTNEQINKSQTPGHVAYRLRRAWSDRVVDGAASAHDERTESVAEEPPTSTRC